MAKKNEMATVRIMAKDLVRTRQTCKKIMQEFEKQSEMMNMKEEMMNDVMDDAMGDEDDEEETEAVVGKVLAELGLENVGELNTIPAMGEDPK